MSLRQQYVFLDSFLDDTGTVSPEYAIVIVAGVTMGLILVMTMRGEAVRQAVSDLVQGALSVSL
jgi:hypothetical protein